MKNKWDIRQKMYLDYKRELCAMDGLDDLREPEELYIKDLEVARELVDVIEWVPIKKDSKEVGFIFITKGRLLKHGEDYRVEEAYVRPEYRKQGLMTKAAKDYFKKHHGKWSLQVMINNPDSLKFWLHLIGKRFSNDIGIYNNDDGSTETMELFFDIGEDYGEKE